MRHLFFLLLFPATVALADPPPLERAMRLEVHGSVAWLSDDDLDATYGPLPGGELGASWAMGRRSRLVLSLGYATADGDPYYDTPDFDAGPVARLHAVPLTVGCRFASSDEDAVRVVLGAAVQLTLIEERLPTGETAGGLQTLEGNGAGLLFTLGPEWSLKRGRHLLNLDLVLGGSSGEVHADARRHDVDLRSFQLRLGYALALGSEEVR